MSSPTTQNEVEQTIRKANDVDIQSDEQDAALIPQSTTEDEDTGRADLDDASGSDSTSSLEDAHDGWAEVRGHLESFTACQRSTLISAFNSKTQSIEAKLRRRAELQLELDAIELRVKLFNAKMRGNTAFVTSLLNANKEDRVVMQSIQEKRQSDRESLAQYELEVETLLAEMKDGFGGQDEDQEEWVPCTL